MMNKTIKKTNLQSFERRILFAGIIPNFISSTFIFMYSIWMMQMEFSFTYIAACVIFGLTLVAQIIFAPLTNIAISRSLSKKIKIWETEGFSVEERTKLFKEIQAFPRKKQFETIIYFIVCSVFLTIIYAIFFEMTFLSNLASFVSCLFGTYIAGQLALSFSTKICSDLASKVVAQGIDDNEVQNQKVFGLSFGSSFILYVVIPIVCTTILFFCLFLIDYIRSDCQIISSNQLKQIAVILLINTFAAIILVLTFFKTVSDSSNLLHTAMQHINTSDIFTVELISTDISNELSYNIYLVNNVVALFRSIFDKVKNIASKMKNPISELTDIANETATTSFEQAAGVREILATMEENDEQSRTIVKKIMEVSDISEYTSESVEKGFETLRVNLEKMNDITEANISTITGIKELGSKIEGIWEIVNIIKDIAEQTRIIAFNAELEASGAGTAGKNFHIVANEIRRLAAGITESVAQIRERITEIQHSSDNLIITSESGTEKIREGCQLSANLESKFADIQTSSEITVESVVDIRAIIEQQSVAFDQIVSTIRQISIGIENTSNSTHTVNTAATKLQESADRLENLQKEISVSAKQVDIK